MGVSWKPAHDRVGGLRCDDHGLAPIYRHEGGRSDGDAATMLRFNGAPIVANEFSFATTITLAGGVSRGVAIGFGRGEGAPYRLLMVEGGKLVYSEHDGRTLRSLRATESILPDIEHDVVVVRTKTRVSLYVDGTFAGSAVFGDGLKGDLEYVVGGRPLSNNNYDLVWNGKIANIMMWDRALSETEALEAFRPPDGGNYAFIGIGYGYGPDQ